ncbi:hypothetical protein [Sphingomonas sp. OK281]|jgi:hypothetical protein|uniref:hypothetical protein n=1 Tax=Sphingomonas sp. OK281 TaxID=1881067 RepID=UPI0008E134A1|nr:hypothetical protein [Sphingomonas sp. OK281]SFO46221.1 hypothetical protein SAMN05428984_4388 [Sphingomonas sp. OK281]
MQSDRAKTDVPSEVRTNVPVETAKSAIWRPGSAVVAFLSTVGTATLISLLLGLFYYYTHHYREAYLGRLGLDPEALPITTQEAIVEGFDGIVTTILWKLALVTLFIPVYLAIVWIGGVLLEGFATRFGITSGRRTPHPLLIALGRSAGFRASVIVSAIAIGVTIFSSLVVILIGIPAQDAGVAAANDLLSRVQSTTPECARYEMKGGSGIVGWPVGSTPDRQFVLGNDHAAHVVNFDDLQRLKETGVTCRTPSAGTPSRHPERDRSK